MVSEVTTIRELSTLGVGSRVWVRHNSGVDYHRVERGIYAEVVATTAPYETDTYILRRVANGITFTWASADLVVVITDQPREK